MLSKHLHPDGLDPRPDVFEVVQHIYSILGDERLRYQYDTTPEGQAYVSALEIRLAEAKGHRLPLVPQGTAEPQGWSYRADGGLQAPQGLYDALLRRAAELRVARTWRIHVVPGKVLHVDPEWVTWGAELPVTPELVDSTLSRAVGFYFP